MIGHSSTTRTASVSRTNGVKVSIPHDPASAVTLSTGKGRRALTIAMGVPAGSESSRAVVRGGLSIFTNGTDQTATTVNPLADGGVQVLVAIGSPDSPTRYDFPVSVPRRGHLVSAPDGGAQVVLADGRLAATIAAPWAVDAKQRPVPTHFEIHGRSLVQVVDHTIADISYPVVADPKVFTCDWYTHTCVKFTKSETKWIAEHTSALSNGGIGGVSLLCSKMGGIAGAGTCAILVAVGGGMLADTFNKAAGKRKCVELHFLKGPIGGISGGLTHWKTEGCEVSTP